MGSSANAPAADERVDVEGRAVLPGWVDCHTHLVFAGDRTAEFGARMAGKPYTAGGIAVTVGATRPPPTPNCQRSCAGTLPRRSTQGTTFVETKTGYGLNVPDEVRSRADRRRARRRGHVPRRAPGAARRGR